MKTVTETFSTFSVKRTFERRRSGHAAAASRSNSVFLMCVKHHVSNIQIKNCSSLSQFSHRREGKGRVYGVD